MSKGVSIRDGRKRDFFIVENSVLDRHGKQLGPYGIALYNGLARYANADGRCNPSIATLAGLLGMSPRQTREKLRQLEDLGLVETEAPPAGVKSATNAYVLRSPQHVETVALTEVTPAHSATPAPRATVAPHAGDTSVIIDGLTPARGATPAHSAAKQDLRHKPHTPLANARGVAARRDAAPTAAAPRSPKRTRPPVDPAPHQAMFGEVAEVSGLDPQLMDAQTRIAVAKAAKTLIDKGVPPGMPTAAWDHRRQRLESWAAAEGRVITPPSPAKLVTYVGEYRKALEESQSASTLPDRNGRYRDPETGRLVVDAWRAGPAR